MYSFAPLSAAHAGRESSTVIAAVMALVLFCIIILGFFTKPIVHALLKYQSTPYVPGEEDSILQSFLHRFSPAPGSTALSSMSSGPELDQPLSTYRDSGNDARNHIELAESGSGHQGSSDGNASTDRGLGEASQHRGDELERGMMRAGSPTSPRGWVHRRWSRFDDKVMKPIFGGQGGPPTM